MTPSETTQAVNFAYPFVELEIPAPCSDADTDRLMSQRFQQAYLAVLRDILVSSYSDDVGIRLNTPEQRIITLVRTACNPAYIRGGFACLVRTCFSLQ